MWICFIICHVVTCLTNYKIQFVKAVILKFNFDYANYVNVLYKNSNTTNKTRNSTE